MNAWERGQGEPLADYTRRLEAYINPDPLQAHITVCEWVYRMRQLADAVRDDGAGRCATVLAAHPYSIDVRSVSVEFEHRKQ